MKKQIILALAIMLLPQFSQATVFGFMDGNYSDISGDIVVMCFIDKNCYDTDGVQVWHDGNDFTKVPPINAVLLPSSNNVVVGIPSPVISLPQNITITPIVPIINPPVVKKMDPIEQDNTDTTQLVKVTFPRGSQEYDEQKNNWRWVDNDWHGKITFNFFGNSKGNVVFEDETILDPEGNAITFANPDYDAVWQKNVPATIEVHKQTNAVTLDGPFPANTSYTYDFTGSNGVTTTYRFTTPEN